MRFGACDGNCAAVAAQAVTIKAQADDLAFLRARVTALETQLGEIAGVRVTLPRPELGRLPKPEGSRLTPWSQGLVADGHATTKEAREAFERAHPRGKVGPMATDEQTA